MTQVSIILQWPRTRIRELRKRECVKVSASRVVCRELVGREIGDS